MPEKIYVGVDIGGTAIKTGICNEEGELLYTTEGPTEVEKGSDTVVNNIAQYARDIVEQSAFSWEQVEGVGIGIAGFLDIPRGFVKLSVNLGLQNVPLKDVLTEKLGKEVRVNNDANVAALGEAWSGAGKDVPHCVCFTLGTGVGGGIITHGKIYEGFSGMAGELGHLAVVPDLEAIQCGCGKMGCLETVSSATGIIRMAKDAVERGDRTSLAVLPSITAKDVFDAAKNGDEVAARIVNRAAFYLGKAMAGVAVIVNPQRFIIGGGVSNAGEFLFEQVREVFHKFTPEVIAEDVEIVSAVLGNNAGIVGAAGLITRS